jgi:hypothetical protein
MYARDMVNPGIRDWQQGRIQDFKLGGGGGCTLKKCAERREARKFLGYFVWKITILRQKNHIFSNFRGGGAPGAPPPPGSAPGQINNIVLINGCFLNGPVICPRLVIMAQGRLYWPEATPRASTTFRGPLWLNRGHINGSLWKHPFLNTFINQSISILGNLHFFLRP